MGDRIAGSGVGRQRAAGARESVGRAYGNRDEGGVRKEGVGIRQNTKTPRSDKWPFVLRRMIKESWRESRPCRCGPQRPSSYTKGRSRRHKKRQRAIRKIPCLFRSTLKCDRVPI